MPKIIVRYKPSFLFGRKAGVNVVRRSFEDGSGKLKIEEFR
jgi:hypothetical protein